MTMKISTLFPAQIPTLSFEVFPPKRESGNVERLFETIDTLGQLEPDFISVTYGAGGSTRDRTVEIASKIKNEFNRETLAHLTCVQSTVEYIDELLDELRTHGIENILALRGDPPQDQQAFVKPEGGFGFANELVEYIAAKDSFCIGVAGYPAGHFEAPDLKTDVINLKRKVDAGAAFIITQLFFVNDVFYRFRDLAVSHGITVPIIPGIFPVFSAGQLDRIAALCGRAPAIPSSFRDRIMRAGDNVKECEKYGIEFSIEQAGDLLKNEVAGLHFYCMNKSSHIMEIVPALPLNRALKKRLNK